METHFKNQRQVEFAELVEVMRAKGVKPAGVARLLKISKASVSKILSGKQTPEYSKLELFRRLVAEQSGSVKYPEAEEGLVMRDEYAVRLRNLPEPDQRAIESQIDYFHHRAKTSSGKGRKAADHLAKKIVASVARKKPAAGAAPPSVP